MQVARAVISVVVLALIARRSDFSWSAAVPTWEATNTAWLVATVALMITAIVLSAFRWMQVLRAIGVHARLSHLTSYYFACQFVSNLLPTTIGGDVVRVARLARETGDTADSFASVLIERLTGWIVLPLFALAGLIAEPDLRNLGSATTVAVTVAAATLFGLGTILTLAAHPRVGGRFAERRDWKRFLGSVHLGVGQLRQQPASAVAVLGAGAAYQFVLVLAALTAARALAIPNVDLSVVLAFYPAVLMLQVLPISISGVGVREGAFVLFLTPLGVAAPQAVALGLLLFVTNLGASLLGLPSYLRGGERP